MTRDPIRWSDPSSGVASPLRRLLDSVAVDEPTSAQLDRVTSGLAAKLGIPAPAIAAPTAAAAATAGKLALVLGLVALVATGTGVWLARGARTAPSATPAIALVAEHAEPVAITPVRTASTSSVEPPPPPAAREPARRAEPPAPVATPPAEDEITLLKSAQAALAADPARAFALAERHAQRFTRGLLREEREAIAIEALAGLGRLAEARGRFAQFVTAHPRSSYRQRLARRLDHNAAATPPPRP